MSFQASVLLDSVHCNVCNNTEIYARSILNEPIMHCQKCQNRGVSVRVEFGYDLEQPAKDTPKYLNQGRSVEDLVDLLLDETEENDGLLDDDCHYQGLDDYFENEENNEDES